MTSEGHQDHHATSAPSEPPSLFRYTPPPSSPPAPYGYPPTRDATPEPPIQEPTGYEAPADPAPPAHPGTVPPAPDRVRATASVRGGPPEPADHQAPAGPEQPAPPPPQAPQPPPEYYPPPPAATPAPFAPPLPERAAEPPAPPTTGDEPVRGAASAVASVPTANRATPAPGQAPPPHASQPRVYQTAAGPPQPVDPPPATAAAEPLPTRTPAEPPLPTRTPAGPLPTRTPAEPPLPTRTPAETLMPNRPPRQRQAGPPVYSDLLGPAATQAPPAAHHSPPGGHPYEPYQPHQPQQPHQPYQPYQPHGEAQQPPWPGQPYIPQQRDLPAPGEVAEPAWPPPTDGGGGTEPADAGKAGPPIALIVGAVLVGATLLVVGALSIPFLVERLRGPAEPTTYAVGDCVVQAGNAAEPADCSEPGAYQIVAQVNSQEECEDLTQPAIEVAGPPAQFFCLAPAGGDSAGAGAE